MVGTAVKTPFVCLPTSHVGIAGLSFLAPPLLIQVTANAHLTGQQVMAQVVGAPATHAADTHWPQPGSAPAVGGIWEVNQRMGHLFPSASVSFLPLSLSLALSLSIPFK